MRLVSKIALGSMRPYRAGAGYGGLFILGEVDAHSVMAGRAERITTMKEGGLWCGSRARWECLRKRCER